MSATPPLLANDMASLTPPKPSQRGHTLAQTLVGMALSMLIISAALGVWAWMQDSHRQLQIQVDAQTRLRMAHHLLRERVYRAAAPELVVDSKGKVGFSGLPDGLQGSDSGLTLDHARSLTPIDCQGHQASDWIWLTDQFMLNTHQEWVCKDNWQDNSSYQALVDGVTSVQFVYAQQLPGQGAQMQWRRADQVSDWRAVRGVGACVQVPMSRTTPMPKSLACSPAETGLSWRGVTAWRHHPP
jgi:hypothetical protein